MDETPTTSFIRKEYKRLTDEDIEEIINARNNGLPAAQIAQQIQCSERQVHRIIKKSKNGEMMRKDKKELDVIHKLDNAVLQEHHIAWLQEELLLSPNDSLEVIAQRLNEMFHTNISVTTIWRNQKLKIAEKIVQELKENPEKHLAPELPDQILP